MNGYASLCTKFRTFFKKKKSPEFLTHRFHFRNQTRSVNQLRHFQKPHCYVAYNIYLLHCFVPWVSHTAGHARCMHLTSWKQVNTVELVHFFPMLEYNCSKWQERISLMNVKYALISRLIARHWISKRSYILYWATQPLLLPQINLFLSSFFYLMALINIKFWGIFRCYLLPHCFDSWWVRLKVCTCVWGEEKLSMS